MNWAPQANPQTPEEARTDARYPEIAAIARDRGITSIVHFTRTSGFKGMLYTSVVKARRHLPEDARVKHVYEENAPDRSRDLRWHGYVNLSITDINVRMFEYSKEQHPCDNWVILGFDPQILGDPGVVFCTTNNAYDLAYRCAGPRGFEQMFALRVPWGHYGSVCTRYSRARNQTTDPQAAVSAPATVERATRRPIRKRKSSTRSNYPWITCALSPWPTKVLTKRSRPFYTTFPAIPKSSSTRRHSDDHDNPNFRGKAGGTL